jgi:hypothetical protein
MPCVFCEVQAELLNEVRMSFVLRSGEPAGNYSSLFHRKRFTLFSSANPKKKESLNAVRPSGTDPMAAISYSP